MPGKERNLIVAASTIQRRSLRTLAGLVAVLGLLFALAAPAFAGGADHCADHNGNPGKIQGASGSVTKDGVVVGWSGDPGSITFKNTNNHGVTVSWCAKGGTKFVGDDMTTGPMNTHLGPGAQVKVNFDQAVSYVLLYSVNADQEPEPEEPEESEPEEPQESESEEPQESGSEEPQESESEKPREDTAGGTPTPTPSGRTLPDTAAAEPTTVPTMALSLVLLASLASLASLAYLRFAERRARGR